MLQQGIYSTVSDVWSYGITLWEIYSLGNVPWNGSSSTEVGAHTIVVSCNHLPYQITDAYLSNRQLDKPKRCHQLIYDVMLSCWNIYPEKRISFNNIRSALNEVSDETTVCSCVYAIVIGYLNISWFERNIKLDSHLLVIFESPALSLLG